MEKFIDQTTLMKLMQKQIALTLSCIFISGRNAFAFDPPGPGGDPSTNPNNDPLGGGAPLGDGLVFLILIGIIYAGLKIYHIHKSKNISSSGFSANPKFFTCKI